MYTHDKSKNSSKLKPSLLVASHKPIKYIHTYMHAHKLVVWREGRENSSGIVKVYWLNYLRKRIFSSLFFSWQEEASLKNKQAAQR